jgi:NADPH-dependent 7-cyano-7-deazaguanine reductase QueF
VYIKTININFHISGTKITIPFSAICSVTNKQFKGGVIIEYHPNKKVIEYVDTEKKIKNITEDKLTAEEFAHRIFKIIEMSISPKYLKILIDVRKSKVHQPVQVWIEKNFK